MAVQFVSDLTSDSRVGPRINENRLQLSEQAVDHRPLPRLAICRLGVSDLAKTDSRPQLDRSVLLWGSDDISHGRALPGHVAFGGQLVTMVMPQPPLDPPVADQAPEAEVLTGYDHYPCSQHVSCAGGRVQRVDSIHLSAKRGDETGCDLLVGRDGAVQTRGVNFPTIIFEC